MTLRRALAALEPILTPNCTKPGSLAGKLDVRARRAMMPPWSTQGERQMIRLLGALAATIFMTGAVAAETCAQRAANCVGKGGARETCYAPQRMADCARTGQYVAQAVESGQLRQRPPERRNRAA